MKISFTPSAWNDYTWFQDNDRKLVKRINLLIRDCVRTPLKELASQNPQRIIGWPLVATNH
jgi:toxin YoeB